MAQDPIYTTAVHAGENPAANLGSLSVPLYNSAVFAFPDAEQGAAIHAGKQAGYYYGRSGNPTQSALEDALCKLENGPAALAFSSGMAAVSSAFLTLLTAGDPLAQSWVRAAAKSVGHPSSHDPPAVPQAIDGLRD